MITSETKSTWRINTRKKLGASITDRHIGINSLTEFGHWEIDTIIGEKSSNDNVLLTILEPKTRYSIVLDIVAKTANAVTDALSIVRSLFGEKFSKVFKTITSDNELGADFLSNWKVLMVLMNY